MTDQSVKIDGITIRDNDDGSIEYGGNKEFKIRDEANSQTLLTVESNGKIEIPNGTFNEEASSKEETIRKEIQEPCDNCGNERMWHQGREQVFCPICEEESE